MMQYTSFNLNPQVSSNSNISLSVVIIVYVSRQVCEKEKLTKTRERLDIRKEFDSTHQALSDPPSQTCIAFFEIKKDQNISRSMDNELSWNS